MFDAVPNDSTGYVFAAYIVFVLLLVVYLGILGAKFQRISRDLTDLTEEVEAGRNKQAAEPAPAASPGAEEPSSV